jgi:hypothetical protein
MKPSESPFSENSGNIFDNWGGGRRLKYQQQGCYMFSWMGDYHENTRDLDGMRGSGFFACDRFSLRRP